MLVLVVISLVISVYIGLAVAWKTLSSNSKSAEEDYGINKYMKEAVKYHIIDSLRKK